MNILYISNRFQINKSESMAWFSPFCEPQDLYIKDDFELAIDFLQNEIIKPQKHLDFIITDWVIGKTNAKNVLNWIKNSTFNYSSNNFKLRSLPVLLIEDAEMQSDLINEGFDSIVQDFPTDHLKLKESIQSSIKSWRYQLANDLQVVGLNPQTLKLYPNDRKAFISYYKLKILSREFVESKSKKLNYVWGNNNIYSLNNINQQFFDHIKKAKYNPSKYMEKETHAFLKSNETLLLGENFSNSLYEPRLKKERNLIDIPDFINKPHVYSLRHPEVFEVKRITQRLVRNNERLISKARRSFEQVKRYQRYMESKNPYYKAQIIDHLGKEYDGYEYTLFMGSKDEKEEYLDLIYQLRKEFDFMDINLVTYEELLEKHIRLCDRLMDFDIYN
jgi:hypothetical protein